MVIYTVVNSYGTAMESAIRLDVIEPLAEGNSYRVSFQVAVMGKGRAGILLKKQSDGDTVFSCQSTDKRVKNDSVNRLRGLVSLLYAGVDFDRKASSREMSVGDPQSQDLADAKPKSAKA